MNMNNSHYSICIGRKFGSSGRNVAHIVANELGIKVYDNNLLKSASEETGFSEQLFEEADEEKTRKGLLSLFKSHLTDSGFTANYLSNESIFNMQSEAVRKIHEREDCIFIGRCADYVLRNTDRLLTVFIAASIEDRVDRIVRHTSSEITPKKARAFIDDIDRKRAQYYNYMSGKVWGDPACYDICLNSSTLGYEKCAQIIVEMARERFGL